MWFSDEKVITMAAPKNLQNDRLYVPVTTKKKHTAAERLPCTRPTLSRSVMVSVGISKLGCVDLNFVDPGAKINGAFYDDVLLSQRLLPVMCVASSSLSNRTTPLHTGHATLYDFWCSQHWLSVHQIFGHQTAQTSIRLTKRHGASCSSESVSRKCITLTN